jgi:[NiFe] hydrogenase assembly HybE family chaperone
MRVHTADPSPRLEAAFVRIQRDAMAGVPMLHPALRVQALGFARWEGHWLGALVTPWFLNLVLVPGELEHHRRADRLAHGIPLAPALVDELDRIGRDAGAGPFPR